MHSRRKLLSSLVVIPLLALAACGSGASGATNGDASSSANGKTASSANGKTVKLRVGFAPTAVRSPVYLGVKEGFFEEEGLDVTPVPLNGNAAITAALNGGSVDVGGVSTDGFVVATANGVKMKAVATAGDQPAPAGVASHDSTNAIIVAKGSSIKSPKDLEGKTVAVNELKGLFQLATAASMRRAGADPSKVKYIAMSFPQSLQAVEAGRVDAAAEVEPFITQGLLKGGRLVLNLYPYDPAKQESWVVGLYAMTDSYLSEHPDVATRFARAITKANAFAQKNPDAVREILPSYTEVSDAVLQKMILPHWRDEPLSVEDLQAMSDALVKNNFIKNAPDVKALMFTG